MKKQIKTSTVFIIMLMMILIGIIIHSNTKKPTLVKKESCDVYLDSISKLNTRIDTLNLNNTILLESITILNDSIVSLKNNQLTKEQFINLYKYESLLKYYNICKRDNSQWVFYKGWSTRVFEE